MKKEHYVEMAEIIDYLKELAVQFDSARATGTRKWSQKDVGEWKVVEVGYDGFVAAISNLRICADKLQDLLTDNLFGEESEEPDAN